VSMGQAQHPTNWDRPPAHDLVTVALCFGVIGLEKFVELDV